MKIITVPKWIMPFGYGLTLYKIVFIRKDSKNFKYVLEHEKVHVKQWTEIGLFKFPILYIIELMKNGYYMNKYEMEARATGAKNAQGIDNESLY